MEPVATSHIDSHPDRCGGRPCIAGTRIRVYDVYVWHDLRGLSPEEIVAEFPQVTLADVYAALAYYHDHRLEIQADAELDRKLVADSAAARATGQIHSTEAAEPVVPGGPS